MSDCIAPLLKPLHQLLLSLQGKAKVSLTTFKVLHNVVPINSLKLPPAVVPFFFEDGRGLYCFFFLN